MPANAKIKTACPICGSKYKVAATAVGQTARCSHCKTKFRVAEYATKPKLNHVPSEEDILSWLSEETEEQDYPAPPPRTRMDIPLAEEEADPVLPVSSETRTESLPANSPADRLKPSIPKTADTLQFRRTG